MSVNITPYDGGLVDSLLETAEAHLPGRPALIRKPARDKPTARDYFRLTAIPEGTEGLRCTSADCGNRARVLVDSRDSEALAFCRACAHVEFAMWMVAV